MDILEPILPFWYKSRGVSEELLPSSLWVSVVAFPPSFLSLETGTYSHHVKQAWIHSSLAKCTTPHTWKKTWGSA